MKEIFCGLRGKGGFFVRDFFLSKMRVSSVVSSEWMNWRVSVSVYREGR